MSSLDRARTAIVGDLTRPRHMLAVSAVIMGATFLPIFGGLPRPSEVAELRAVFFAPEATAAEPSDHTVAQAPRTQSAPRVQRTASAEQEAELTTLELGPALETEPDLIGADAEAIDEATRVEPLIVEDAEPQAHEELEPVTPAA